MIKVKNYLILLLCGLMLASAFLVTPRISASADEGTEPSYDYSETVNIGNEKERGLAVTIHLYINGENGYVTAEIYNAFTLGFSTIPTHLQLYKSSTVQYSVEDMTLVASVYKADLNIWETIKCSASTGGETMFWRVKARYRIDNDPWIEIESETVLYDGDANLRATYYDPEN